MTGLTEKSNEHIYKSSGGKAAVWAGAIDDLWKMGKPRGQGGPWKNTPVQAQKASDPYLMAGYDHKSVALSSNTSTNINLEIDIDGTGVWIPYKSFVVEDQQSVEHTFPDGFSAYWVRAQSDTKCTATVWFTYK
ncbi:MAG: hypothetical protein HQL32_17415 [Planctomycetes bacterium]|nr:hypothetical protein [Planctomycetota bacterium]